MIKILLRQNHRSLCLLGILSTSLLLYGQGYAQNPAPPPTTDSENNAPQNRPGDDQDDNSQQPPAQNSGQPDYTALPAPFGLQWGEGPQEIMEWASSRQFRTAWKQSAQAQGTEAVLEVLPPTGTDQFPDAEFNDLNFAFKNGHLVEVKVIFRYKDQSEAQTETLTQKRKSLVDKDHNQTRKPYFK